MIIFIILGIIILAAAVLAFFVYLAGGYVPGSWSKWEK